MKGFSGAPHDTATENWTRAVATYRAAVDAYRRVAALRATRQPAGGDAASAMLPTTHKRANRQRSKCVGPGELTRREHEIAELIALGYSNKQIARELVVTPGTVANHVAHILNKLGLLNRTQVARHLLNQAHTASVVPLRPPTNPEERLFAV